MIIKNIRTHNLFIKAINRNKGFERFIYKYFMITVIKNF